MAEAEASEADAEATEAAESCTSRVTQERCRGLRRGTAGVASHAAARHLVPSALRPGRDIWWTRCAVRELDGGVGLGGGGERASSGSSPRRLRRSLAPRPPWVCSQ